ncbi:MAG: hypothetical protein IJ205_07615 [Bacteroidales bacterium]|nr:hypothetical protein [Bacteroidales bacterium]
MSEEYNVNEPNKAGFFKRLVRSLRNILILAMILIPIGYSAKLQMKLRDERAVSDSLRMVIGSSSIKLDSLKFLQDSEALQRDSLDDIVDRMLGDRSSIAMIAIDTTLDVETARKAIEESVEIKAWVDSLCAPFPEGVSAHVKLHFLEEKAIRLERLSHHLHDKFPE